MPIKRFCAMNTTDQVAAEQYAAELRAEGKDAVVQVCDGAAPPAVTPITSYEVMVAYIEPEPAPGGAV